MTVEEAKATLTFYRPGTADEIDPAFAEALHMVEENEELRGWFDDHCSVYESLRHKLKEISVPEGLAEQIIAERKTISPGFWRVPIGRTTIAGIAAVLAVGFLVTQLLPKREETGFVGYRDRMVSTALRSYGMDLTTSNLADVRSYLQQHGSVADFTLPVGLENAQLVGCVATTWQGKPVSMICFHSKRPNNHEKQSDLWLFVTDRTSVSGAPTTSAMQFTKLSSWNVTVATWNQDGKDYMLAVEGDEEWLKNYL